MEARAAIVDFDWTQFGVRASATVTLRSVSPPVFVTTIVKFAVPPLEIVCDFGFFVIEIAGVTHVFVASLLSPDLPSLVVRVRTRPPTVTRVVARRVVVPFVDETTETEQVPLPPVVMHWPFEGVSDPGPLWMEKVTRVPSVAGTKPLPSPLSMLTVALNVCATPTSFVALGGVIEIWASTQCLTAFALSPECPSPVVRVRVTPFTLNVVVAWRVVWPLVAALSCTEQPPPVVVH
jgi:hypothetical protein